MHLLAYSSEHHKSKIKVLAGLAHSGDVENALPGFFQFLEADSIL
jgi:hypothetical protein